MNVHYPKHCKGILPDEKNKGQMLFREIQISEPKANELLVQVYAAGVNRADVEQAKGNYPPPLGASPVIGLELAGVVVDVGKGVKQFKKGDRVMSLVSGGAYAEFALAPEETTLHIPKNMSFREAAAIPEAYFTIWYNVFNKGRLQAGEIILIHGGTSGVGSTTIQIVKAMGGIVIATVGSDEKTEACRKLGADLVINHKTQNFYESVMSFTEQKGIDVVFDWVGAEYLTNHLKLLRKNGRLLCVDSKDSRGPLDFGLLLGKCLTISGALLRPLPLEDKLKLTDGIKKYLLPKLESQEIKPLIYQVLPLKLAQEAHQILGKRSHIGKVILSMDMPPS